MSLLHVMSHLMCAHRLMGPASHAGGEGVEPSRYQDLLARDNIILHLVSVALIFDGHMDYDYLV